MTVQAASEATSLYDRDFNLWLEQTVTHLKAENFTALDLTNLIEEIESVGRSQKSVLLSYLMRLCEHLLKLAYWVAERERCYRGWTVEIVNFRIGIQDILNDRPSLKSYLEANFVRGYTRGRKLLLTASDLPSKQVPETPEFSLAQALDEDWLPWEPQAS